MTSLKPPSPERVRAATERIAATGRVVTTDLYVLAMTMWFVCEEQGLLDDHRCELARAAARAVFESIRSAYQAENGRWGDYFEVLAWQAARDEQVAQPRDPGR